MGLRRELGGSGCLEKERDASAAAFAAGWEQNVLVQECDKISSFIVDEATGILVYGMSCKRPDILVRITKSFCG